MGIPSCRNDDSGQKEHWWMDHERNVSYEFCRKPASVGCGLTGTNAVSENSLSSHSRLFLRESASRFSKTEGFGKGALFPFTEY